MGRQVWKFEGVFEVVMIFKLLTICMNVATSYGQPGFLSLDCGSGRDNYTDDIGLSWVNDEPYVGTGSNSGPLFNSIHYDNSRALESFRYFPEPRNKYCYDLPTNPNVSYLIRAMFYCTSSVKVLRPPIEFNVFINNTMWFTIDTTSDKSSSNWINILYRSEEGIFFSPGGVIYFCLQPVKGIPFISSLEMRRLDQERIMYKYVGNKIRYLSLENRLNYGTGTSDGGPTVRFPDDPYDRFWWPYTYGRSDSLGNRTGLVANTSSEVNNVPTKVILDAEIMNSSKVPIYPSDDLIYVAVYFQDFNATDSGGQVVTIAVYNDESREEVYANRTFSVTAEASMQVFPNLVLGGKEVIFDFSGLNSALAPSVNALEVYANRRLDITTTDQYDLSAIKALQSSFNLNSWRGDPCYPVPFAWLACTGGSIYSITLTNLTEDGWPSFMNASYHNFGFPQTSYTYFSTSFFNEMSLTHSEINNAIFQYLIENFQLLSTLNLSYNTINDIPPFPSGGKNLLYLDLSHNALNGVLPLFTWSFINVSQQFRYLDISYNNLNGVDPDDLYFSNLTYLQTINFDRNNIQGTLNLTTWYESLKKNATLPGPLFMFVNNDIKDISPKVEDFELIIGQRLSDKDPHFNETGVLGYFAPEYASEGKLTEKADVFSFGILVLEIVSGRKAIDYDMPSERMFLKDWVQKLHKDGMLLEVLQRDLPQNYVEDEVMRVINIALICVQMDPERRATMSQVVTMLLGSMDVTVFLDMGNQHQPNFNTLFPTNENHNVTDASSFHKCNAIVEEYDESPLLQVDFKSSLPSHSNITHHSIATIELSDMSGR